jgi:hypothetical protein
VIPDVQRWDVNWLGEPRHAHPACDLHVPVAPDTLWPTISAALRRERFRLGPDEGGRVRAERGHKWLAELWDVNWAPVFLWALLAPLPYSRLTIALSADATGSTIRSTCEDGYQYRGTRRRVARTLTRLAGALQCETGVPVTVSAWFSDPAWERPVSDA